MRSSRNHRIIVAKVATITFAVPFLIWAYASGPDPRHTGAPGDQTCAIAGCHSGNLNTGQGKVEITFPGGLTYTPGQRQRWTVTVSHPGARVYGFQTTARLESNTTAGQAGTFSTTDGSTQILCDDGSNRPSAGCRANATVEFIEHTRPLASGTWTVDWTPPATASGNVRVYIAGNGANNNGAVTGDFIYTTSYTLTPASTGGGGGPRPSITSGGVGDAWVGSTGVAPNTWTAIYGSDLTTDTKTWDNDISGTRLPTTISGVSVTIDGRPATINFISPAQINVLVPSGIGTGNAIPVIVKNANGESTPLSVAGAGFKPTFYVFPQQPANNRVYLTAVALDGTYVGKQGTDPRVRRGARPGEVLQFFGTGFGPTNPAVPTDQLVSGAPSVTTANRIRFGETVATIVGGGNGNLVGAGLYQFNVTVPATLADGEYPLIAEIGGVSSSSTVYVVVQR